MKLVVVNTADQLVIARTRNNYGDCSFSVRGPRVWNILPVGLQSADISLQALGV